MSLKDRINRRIMQNDKQPTEKRLAAMELLPYPEEREALIETALNDHDEEIRVAALARLPYPQERETLIRAALSDRKFVSDQFEALKRLPYPEERDTLVKALRKGENSVVTKFPYPEEREILIETARSGWVYCSRLAEKLLPYPEEREVLSELALNEADWVNRGEIIERLSYPEERETLIRAALEDKVLDNRLKALHKLEYPADRETLLKIMRDDPNEKSRITARDKLPYRETVDDLVSEVREIFDNGGQDVKRIQIAWKASIALAMVPRDSREIMRFLCQSIEMGLNWDRTRGDKRGDAEAEKKTRIALGGWSAAALGRAVAKQMKPEMIASNLERFTAAVDRYNACVSSLTQLQRQYESKEDANEKQEVLNRIREKRHELDIGLGSFMLENGDLPLAYLVHILRDNQSQIPRFIKQGVIMGLQDWLLEHKDHSEAAKLLETVISVRKDMIQSDNELTFFEVRVPEDCCREDYAMILSDVLHCANPSLSFCDTKELLAVAEREVPGCMDMLRACPMRLIDPVNRQTMGFYQFRPYAHAMWVRYQPPKDTGKVIARYHEVDDHTRPLSSGLSLALFRDPWAVIPTIFHEYQHFTGDRNEASVFLKTQLFSIGFYKKYREANAAADGVFAQMTSMLGLPPDVAKRDSLNEIIERCYGKQVDVVEAEKLADKELNRMNIMIQSVNQRETWDPEVTFPLLVDEEDWENEDLIRKIVIRFATAPKSVTAEEFQKILEAAD